MPNIHKKKTDNKNDHPNMTMNACA